MLPRLKCTRILLFNAMISSIWTCIVWSSLDIHMCRMEPCNAERKLSFTVLQ